MKNSYYYNLINKVFSGDTFSNYTSSWYSSEKEEREITTKKVRSKNKSKIVEKEEIDSDAILADVDTSAGYKNTLGYYSVDENGTITGVQIAYTNVHKAKKGNEQGLDLDGSPYDTGFFIIADGARLNKNFKKFDLEKGELKFVFHKGEADERLATINDNAEDIDLVYTLDGKETVIKGDTYHATVTGEVDNLNPDGKDHGQITTETDGDKTVLNIGFEDLYNLGDKDYNDVTFKLEIKNQAPEAKDDVISAVSDNVITGNVLVDNGNGADSDPENDTFTVTAQTITTASGGTVVLLVNGDFTYTPNGNFIGQETFIYNIVDDQGRVSEATVTLDIADNEINDGDEAGQVDGTQYFDHIDGQGGDDTINAGGGDDIVSGGDGADTVDAGTGDDTVSGGNGYDVLLGQEGNDTMYGESGNDILRGHAGQDTLYGGAGNDFLFGGEDNDTLYGGENNDNFRGDEGDDTIYAGTGNDRGFGNEGVDIIYAGEGNDYFEGNQGEDTIFGDEGDDTLFGNEDNDLLHGGTGADKLYGGTGDDTINGDEDNDVLAGEDGNDTINGGDGDDLIYGGAGLDTIDAGAGVDKVYGGLGNDVIHGGDDNDTLIGEAGDDTIHGDAGDDTLYGVSGLNTIYGGVGVDKVYGGTDADTIHGGDDKDTLLGANGNDVIYGDAGNDLIYGQNGDDVLYGGGGEDNIWGGAGADTFKFQTEDMDGTINRIRDFRLGEGDILDVSDVLEGYDPLTHDINDFITFTTPNGAGDVSMAIDRDGTGSTHSTGWAAKISTAGEALDVQTMINDGQLIV